jgi:ketosteroid isomerase-like protein
MNRIQLTAPLGILLTALACGPREQAPAGLADADAAAIRASVDAFARDVIAKNFASASSLYADNAVFNPPNEPAINGRAAILAWMEKFPPVSAFTVKTEEVEGRGDLAYVRGTYTMTFTPPGAPAPITDEGKFLEVRRKQADGRWLIATDMFNSNLAAPTLPAPSPLASPVAPSPTPPSK